jgi:hypothetical protein
MQPQSLGQLPADAVDRVQGAGRLLEDHADPVAAQRSQLPGGQSQQVAPVEDRLAGVDLPGARDKAHQRQRADTLAAA